MSTATRYESLGQVTEHTVDGWTHEVTLNGTTLYRGWRRKKAERIAHVVSLAIHGAGQNQLEHCNRQLADRAKNLGAARAFG